MNINAKQKQTKTPAPEQKQEACKRKRRPSPPIPPRLDLTCIDILPIPCAKIQKGREMEGVKVRITRREETNENVNASGAY